MKAPDKIYVTPVGTWDTEHIPDLQDNIYIRKDAMLEWANELKEKRLMGYIMFDELLEKIESL